MAPYVIHSGADGILVYAGSALICHDWLLSAGWTCIPHYLFLINIRRLLLCLRPSFFFVSLAWCRNIVIGSFLTDESYGILMGGRHIQRKSLLAGWWAIILWVTLPGFWVLFGNSLRCPSAQSWEFGLDFAPSHVYWHFLLSLQSMLRRVKIKKLFSSWA